MRSWWKPLPLVALAGLLLGACRPAAPTPPVSFKMELRSEKITSQALAGNLLGDPAERPVYVLLPPTYSTSDKRYPVLYVLPGGDGEPKAWMNGFRASMETLLLEGEVPEMIIVTPDGTNKLGASQFRSSKTIGDYETYVTQEVVGYVEAHFRTLPSRDSRGLAGCSNGGEASMRLALKYPEVFGAVAVANGGYTLSPDVWPSHVQAIQQLTELPQDASLLTGAPGWWIQAAAGVAPDPDNPPFYCEMPFRIAAGHGEFIPEVVAKIVESDAPHEARRYLQQPIRLRGILVQFDLQDTDQAPSLRSFRQSLADLGIDYDYREFDAPHCGHAWEAESLKFMAGKLQSEGGQ